MLVVQAVVIVLLMLIIGEVLHRLVQDAVNKPIELVSTFVVDHVSLTLTLLELSFDSLSAQTTAKH